jgi:hypothetical protein
VTSNHQTTNLVFPKFFYQFFSVSVVKKENKLFIGTKPRKTCFGPIKSLFSFSTAQAEKNWGKQDWWFDVTNRILSS